MILPTDKRQFLDPITTIGKIILIHFSPVKTKIRILDHSVHLVSDNMWEKLSRNYYGDNRNDISVLFPIFIRYIELYLIGTQKSNKNEQKELLENLKLLGEYCIFGINELQKTYDYDNAVFTLQYYILLIREGINGTYSEKSLPNHLKELTKNNLFDDTKIQKIWEDLHIIELAKTFKNCFDAEKNNDIILLDSNKEKIFNILSKHDELFKKNLVNE